MIAELSLAKINSQAPYIVERAEITGSYDFVTAAGVQITIDFDDDFMISSGTSYQLIIGNANHKKSGGTYYGLQNFRRMHQLRRMCRRMSCICNFRGRRSVCY